MKKLKEIQVVDELAFALEVATFSVAIGMSMLAILPAMLSAVFVTLGDKLNARRTKKGESMNIHEAADLSVAELLMFAITIVVPDSLLYSREEPSEDGGVGSVENKESDQKG